MKKVEIGPGESFLGIAEKHGFFWKTLWEHTENKELRERRKSPGNVLVGDVVAIPDRSPVRLALGSGKPNTFVKKSNRVQLRLKLQFDGKPLKDAPFVVEGEGFKVDGKTTSVGEVKAALPASASQATLTVRPDDASLPKELKYQLTLASLEDLDTDAGVQQRLQRTGHYTGMADGTLGAEAQLALKSFQRSKQLEESGEADETTRQALADSVMA